MDLDIDGVSSFTLIWVSIGRLLVGYTLVILTRLVCKIVLKSLLGYFIRLLDLECFDLEKIKGDQSIRYYGPSFKLPPVYSSKGKKGRKSQPDGDDASAKWHMQYLVNYGTYICVGWMGISGAPLLCHIVGLTL